MAGDDYQTDDARLPAAGALRWLFRGYETFVFVVALGPILDDLLSPYAASSLYFYAGIVLAATLLGWAVGGTARALTINVVGQVNAITISLLGYAVVAGLTAASETFLAFAIFRFLAGAFLGIGGELTNAAARTTDDRYTGSVSAGFGGGIVLASVAWAVLQTFDPQFLAPVFGPGPWRYLFAIGVLPAIATPFVRRVAGSAQLTRNDDRTDTISIGDMFRGLTRRRTIVAAALAFAALAGWWGVVAWLPAYATTVTEGYGLARPDLWAAIAGACYGIGGIAGSLTAGTIAERIGRVGSLLVMAIGSLSTVFGLFLLIRTPVLFSVMAVVVGYFTVGQFGWLSASLPELVPSDGTAIAVVWATARLVAVPLPILIGYEIAVFDGIDTVVAASAAVYAVGILAVCYLPERETLMTDSRSRPAAETNG
ncbi:MFS transporter [Halococcus sp. AFM35]|uniref:MFS transporter n=1 Tax=Halococcus sp. AFM35 TaxID=3421653 RepID=UPI003EB73BF6